MIGSHGPEQLPLFQTIAPPYSKITIKFTSTGGKSISLVNQLAQLWIASFEKNIYWFYTFHILGTLLFDERVLQFYQLMFLIISKRNPLPYGH